MIDVVGPRLNELANQLPLLNFNPEQEQRLLELIAVLEALFKEVLGS
jgi:hypothetical protein